MVESLFREKENLITYPCLMRYSGDRKNGIDQVVLFYQESHGTVVSSNQDTVGEYLIDFSMEDYTPLPSNIEIVLSNK